VRALPIAIAHRSAKLAPDQAKRTAPAAPSTIGDMEDVIGPYEFLAGFLLLGMALGAVPLVIPRLIAPRYSGPKTTDTYECGVDTIGSSWIRFSISFYLFALIFVAFEVDVLYLFPIAVVYGEFAWRDLIEVTMFLGILTLGIAYAWRRGVFEWR
jgi:NADH-quinone oxidoreductase subunit A